jgi:hypothetical protein
MRGDDVARLQQALLALGRTVPPADRANGIRRAVFGAGTEAALKSLQADLGLPPNGIVDAATVAAINQKLARLDTDPRVIRGAVRDANGNPVTNGTVEIFKQSPTGELSIGRATLDTADGSYEFSYQPQTNSNGRNGKVDLRLEVRNSTGILDTVPSGASILTNAGTLEVVNFMLGGEANQPFTEYERLLADLHPLLGTRKPADLNEDITRHDVSLLAAESEYDTELVAALVISHRLERDAKLPNAAPAFYGLLRRGMPANLNALYATDPGVRLNALQAAVAEKIVPRQVGARNIEDLLKDLEAPAPQQLQTLLSQLLNPTEVKTFVGQYLKESQNPSAFWERIAADPVWASRAADLKLTVQLGVLTNNHAPLVNAVRNLPNVKKPSDLARLTEEKWKSLVRGQGVGVPAETPGANADEKINNYVKQILDQIEASFPAQVLAARLPASPVATLLKNNPAYDLKRTYPEQFFKANPAAAANLTAEDRHQLRALQRLYRLTSNTRETMALVKKGVGSAQQISRMDRKVFAELHQDSLSTERAKEIHERASRTNAIALALLAEHGAHLNRTGLPVLPKLRSEKNTEAAANSIPDWATLFGTFDLCACQECSSAHGPAAYFVDILQFLGERKNGAGLPAAIDVLFARRPDLGDLELSCENTNTVLPLIDLVNEVLENAVSPPSSFTPTTLAPALESDLGQMVATAALSAAFNPRLEPGAQVETLEAGKRWRIWDELFAYNVVKDNNAIKVTARSRQTGGSAEERRATPQYLNRRAYDELGTAVYPWNLPFDLAKEEADIFLAHLGVSRGDLIEALRPVPEPFDPNSPAAVRLAAERLHLTDTERKIVVGEPLTPSRPLEDFWGSAPGETLRTVEELLDRSALSYAELDELLTTWFINPSRSVTISAQPGADIDTCDITKLQVNGLTAEVLSRMHRFVRVWRRLGWTIPEVDRAIRTFAPDQSAPVLTNTTLVRIDHVRSLCDTLRLSVAQTLAFWKPIDTAEPGSLYRSLFYNPAVFKPQHEDFRLRPDGRELISVDKPITDHADALQAAFRLSAQSFSLLSAKTNGKLSLASLSLIYRHAIMARQLGLTVQDLLTAIDLTGLDPFRVERAQNAVRLVEVVNEIRSSGFDFSRLAYLLRDRFTSATSFRPVDATLAQTLTEIRAGLRDIKAPSDAEQRKLEESSVVDRVASALRLPADVTGALLGRVSHGTSTALQRFLELSAVPGPLSRDNAKPQFETIEKLQKIAGIVETLKLPGSQLGWLFRENAWLATAPDPPTTPVPFASWFSLIHLQVLRRELNLEDAALDAILNALNGVVSATGQAARLAARKAFVDALSTWLGWPTEDLQTLIGKPGNFNDLGLLNVRVPADYRIELVVRLHRAMSLLKRLGVAALEASELCDAVVTGDNRNAIRRAAKAKHEDQAWQKIAIPLQDTLRDLQRAALVSYLLARPAKWAPDLQNADENDLYSHFLIDVEMSSCQPTSRIKQAIGSVQLFAQRCLMGLEPDVKTTDPKWAQWHWMKNFRVWEANRKIWLYPENWIEPELRDGKTPFFKDLENELMQADLSDAAAERAFRHYLEKLDEVSQLEIVGVYEDDEDKVLHVFGRTFHTPRRYYYRQRDRKVLSWSPWEQIDLDIEGDHLIPVMWNRKLMLIWPIFTEKEIKKGVELPEPGTTMQPGDPYWEIRLAWSEYQNGDWGPKSLSEPVNLTAYQGFPNVTFRNRPGLTDEGAIIIDPKPRRLVSKELISFKALTAGEALMVQGFLRRDYQTYPPVGPTADSQVACLFGIFQFFGCRKIVTMTKAISSDFPLAPTGTKFDLMGFSESSSSASQLILADSNRGSVMITAPESSTGITIVQDEAASIVGDPSSLLANRIDIPVLDQSLLPFRLLAPHQDVQFVGDRPFFFMDQKRTFLVTSSRHSERISRPGVGDWVNADLAVAWRSDYFKVARKPAVVRAPANDLQPLVMLTPGPNGERVAKRMAPVNLEPVFTAGTLLPTFRTTRQYTFTNFHHPYLCEFVKTLNRLGLKGLLSLDIQSLTDRQAFAAYKPTVRVLPAYPVDEVDFQSGGAYELYNWELFFHIPLLIADRLSKNQRFEDAQRWFHFIFDPTAASEGSPPQSFWRTKPFHDRLRSDYEEQSVKNIEEMIANGPSDELRAAVEAWRSNPFASHAVARLRTTAYQKAVVMKYIDNLIAWGDQLFRRDTLETINEATQLYVLAAEILGRRPEVTNRELKPAVKTFNSLSRDLAAGGLSNALEQIELLLPDAGSGSAAANDSAETPDPPSNSGLYFCIPENSKLLGYWKTVADRLFKIRHCMNIEGQIRQLPLFEPPIDPALLVRARGFGLSLADVVSDISVSRPNYRFAVMLQKANEVVAEVRNLGAALLSTLERVDGEALSTLRSGQEVRLLQAIRDVRVDQINEGKNIIAGLEANRQIVETRKEYYESREFLNALEAQSLGLAAVTVVPLAASAKLRGLAGSMQKGGQVKTGSPTTSGAEFGPYYFGEGAATAASALETSASILNLGSQLTGRLGEFNRRRDDWALQARLATIELKQIDRQLAAAQIRLAISEEELRNHDQQIENARDVDQFLRDKFTNTDLYQWMIGQLSSLYFQSYQLAYDLAKRAEVCMQHELGLKYGETSFVRFGYWDSLRKGLLAGDRLAHDLKRLEVAYLDGNIREYELTKNVSLVSLASEQLLTLKETGACEFEVPEWVFDLDTPGHYRRRLKMVSVTIPCVTGPYTSVHCKLQLLKNSYRQNTDLSPGYERRTTDGSSAADDRFIDDRSVLESIVTSNAQNDTGLFEPGMRDERYLPFEGGGAISSWRLELPATFRTFDYRTISDVILHLRYTARDGGNQLTAAATSAVTNLLSAPDAQPLMRLFSLRHEFPSEWHRFVSSPSATVNSMTVDFAATRFPHFAQSRSITISSAKLILRTRSASPVNAAVTPGQTISDLSQSTWRGQGRTGPWTFGTNSDPKLVDDVFVILSYNVS